MVSDFTVYKLGLDKPDKELYRAELSKSQSRHSQPTRCHVWIRKRCPCQVTWPMLGHMAWRAKQREEVSPTCPLARAPEQWSTNTTILSNFNVSRNRKKDKTSPFMLMHKLLPPILPENISAPTPHGATKLSYILIFGSSTLTSKPLTVYHKTFSWELLIVENAID